MRNQRLIDRIITLGAIAFVGALLLAPAAEAQASRSRSSSSSASSSAPRASGGGSSSAARSSSGRTAVSRSSTPRSTPRANPSRGASVTRPGHRGPSTGPRVPVSGNATHRQPGYGYSGPRHPGYGVHYPYYYGYPYYGYYPYYYPYSSWSFGLGWWGGYYSPYFSLHHSPYYYAPYSHSPYGRAPENARARVEPVGAFDLNIKPKKTEVWVDGRYVGTASRFDGFPDYLWLDEGKHQLIFYLDGHVTVEREVETLAGAVGDLRIVMEKGRSIPPRQLAYEPPPPAPTASAPRPAEPTAERQAEASGVPDSPGRLDLRPPPGRLLLTVQPEDASVYLDGRYLGTGRDLARLHAGLLIEGGEHRLEVVRPGYEDDAIEFSIEAGEEERIEVGLERG